MSSTSCVVLTCLVGYVVFHYIEVSQVKNLSTPLRRACQDDQGGHIICHIWSTGEEVLDGYDSEDLEDPRTIIITRPGTKLIRFHSSVK
jgi:hypothetical protein